MELAGKMQTEEQYVSLEQEKIEAEKASKVVEHATKSIDQMHRHHMDHKQHYLKERELHHRVTGNPHFSGE